MMPFCDSSPNVGLMPNTRLFVDGHTTQPSVSVPTAAAHKLAAGAAADPELEPHGSKLRRYGLRVLPPRAVQPLKSIGAKPRKFAHSDRLALPRMTAPAARSRATMGASDGTWLLTSANDPAVVCIVSPVAMLSLTRIGMPCSGPRSLPAPRSASRFAAMPIA